LIAFVGATLYPVSAPPIADGVLIIRDGRIESIGPRADTLVPEDATVIDVAGRTIIPGLVDIHSHIGGGRLHESLGPAQPAVSAVDAINPSHPSIQRAQAGGITTANIMPGSGKIMGGQTVYIDLVDAVTVDEMLHCEGGRWEGVCGGMKMANGTNPQGSGGDPSSRMGSAYLQRAVMRRGQERLKQRPPDPPPRRNPPEPLAPDLEADALAQLIAGERIVHFHSHRADDIVTALRLREEFGFRLILHHGSEGFKVAEEIAAAGVPVAINVLDTPGGKEETLERRLQNPAVLAAAGVEIAIITDDPVQDSRLLLRSAGLAVRGGLSEADALRALTLTPATLIDLGDQIGSLDVGKQADLAILSGPPLSVWSLVQQTWNDGQLVFDRSDPLQAAYATGGDAAIQEGRP
jgi:imidazolonepropionase-like amidohydrolase